MAPHGGRGLTGGVARDENVSPGLGRVHHRFTELPNHRVGVVHWGLGQACKKKEKNHTMISKRRPEHLTELHCTSPISNVPVSYTHLTLPTIYSV